MIVGETGDFDQAIVVEKLSGQRSKIACMCGDLPGGPLPLDVGAG